MRRKFYVQSIGIWFIFMILTVLLGVFREGFLIPATGLSGTLTRALLLSIPILYVLGITFLFLKYTKATYQQRDTFYIGLIWFILTIAFEFTFGTLVMGHSISALLRDYNLAAGKTWPIFLLFLIFAPFIAYKLLTRRA